MRPQEINVETLREILPANNISLIKRLRVVDEQIEVRENLILQLADVRLMLQRKVAGQWQGLGWK